jgi:hypothetical protein
MHPGHWIDVRRSKFFDGFCVFDCEPEDQTMNLKLMNRGQKRIVTDLQAASA